MIYIFGEHVLYKKKKMFSLYKRFGECPPQFFLTFSQQRNKICLNFPLNQLQEAVFLTVYTSVGYLHITQSAAAQLWD